MLARKLKMAGRGEDEHWASVVLLAQMANADTSTTFDDDSNSNHTLTAGGNAQQDDAQVPPGMSTSGLLDGTGDYVITGASSDWDLSTDDHTIELFFRANTIVAADPLFGWEDEITFEFGAGPKLNFYCNDNGFASPYLQSTTNFSADTWHHIAEVCDSGTSRLYVDGVQEASNAASIDHSSNGTTQRVVIGGNVIASPSVPLGSRGFDGWISSFRVTKGVCRYPDGTTFTVPTLPFPTS